MHRNLLLPIGSLPVNSLDKGNTDPDKLSDNDENTDHDDKLSDNDVSTSHNEIMESHANYLSNDDEDHDAFAVIETAQQPINSPWA